MVEIGDFAILSMYAFRLNFSFDVGDWPIFDKIIDFKTKFKQKSIDQISIKL